ncbi:hypothetical protein BGZ94_005896, partial [Podila epigama]
MRKKNQLPVDFNCKIDPKRSTIEGYMRLNQQLGNTRKMVPLSPFENGFVTFTEYELAAFMCKKSSFKPELNRLLKRDPDEPLSAVEITSDWLPIMAFGLLTQRFICPIAGDNLTVRQKGKAGYAGAIKLLSLDQIHDHINELRSPTFDPRNLHPKGIHPAGLKELNSVRYKRYREELLPNQLLSTTGGSDGYLTEIRNVVKTPQDVQNLWNCSMEDIGDISYLGIDLGQACVVGACALLPDHKSPKDKKKKCRGRKKRGGRRRRGSKKSKRAIAGNDKQENKRSPDGPRVFNLAVKQKAVYQPTFKHRSWMDRRKQTTMTTVPVEPANRTLSIKDVETHLAALRGGRADINEHLRMLEIYHDDLDRFYNGDHHLFKKHKWDAKRAREEEYRRITDSLLRM